MQNGRCRNHGGLHPKGLNHHSTKHGRYSKYLPKGLLERYQEAEHDPDLLSVKSEVSLLQARIGELVQRLYSGESGSLWQELKEAWAGFESAYAAKDVNAIPNWLNQLRNLIQRGHGAEVAWREVAEAIDRKTKVASHEWKRLVDMKQILTAEQATLFAMTILEVITRHTPEKDRRSLMAREIDKLLLSRGFGDDRDDEDPEPRPRVLEHVPAEPALPTAP
jgi:hypothetical protein